MSQKAMLEAELDSLRPKLNRATEVLEFNLSRGHNVDEERNLLSSLNKRACDIMKKLRSLC